MATEPTLDSKAVRALAGAADVAATTIRELSNRVVGALSDEEFRAGVRDRFSDVSNRISATVTDENAREKAREDVRRRLSGLPSEAKALGDDLPAFLRELPSKAAELPSRAKEAFTWERRHELMTEIPARLRDAATQAAHQASKTYDDLADRGEGVVARLRGEYDELLGDQVAAVRGRVADAADDVADGADKIADDLGRRSTG